MSRDDRASIIGIDPGLRLTGYGVLKRGGQRPTVLEAGVIRVTAEQPMETRLLDLAQGLRELVAQYRPEAMAVEDLYAHYQHPRTAILMGHARGVIYLVAAELGMGPSTKSLSDQTLIVLRVSHCAVRVMDRGFLRDV